MEILGPEQQVMQAALQVRSARAELLAANVANADTPGYIARDLKFDDTLARTLETGDASAASSEKIAAPENLRVDGNNVDLNQQLSKAYENSFNYIATLKLYGDSHARLREATSDT
ncbi:MAG TPA: flagellar basal body protein [Candidatus Binataceae bacterium]